MLIIILSTLVVIGFVALLQATKRADIGFEDESGFHFGEEPAKVVPAAVPQAIAATAHGPEKVPETATPAPPQKDLPVRRAARKSSKKVRNEERAAAFQLELSADFPQLIGQEVTAAQKR